MKPIVTAQRNGPFGIKFFRARDIRLGNLPGAAPQTPPAPRCPSVHAHPLSAGGRMDRRRGLPSGKNFYGEQPERTGRKRKERDSLLSLTSLPSFRQQSSWVCPWWEPAGGSLRPASFLGSCGCRSERLSPVGVRSTCSRRARRVRDDRESHSLLGVFFPSPAVAVLGMVSTGRRFTASSFVSWSTCV